MVYPHTEIKAGYESVKEACRRSLQANDAAAAILSFASTSLEFLRNHCSAVKLVSRVPGKAYQAFSFANGGKPVVSRPSNSALFVANSRAVARMWGEWKQGRLPLGDVSRLLYTVALAPCLVMELFDRGNKKGPATYFECLIGHIIAIASGVDARRSATLPVPGSHPARLSMDFLFDLSERVSLHVAVKMSTRERVVQAWAHQRLLDAAFGFGRYRGVMILFGETKLDSRSLEVIEICVPDQWLAYQTHLAKMHRIYYFDPPERYVTLAKDSGQLMPVWPFADFFTETATVLAP